MSANRSGPLVSRNIASIPATLIASELFGHAKGSFTGATEAREGAFVAANGGTLFLDEIGDLPLDLQVQLLTVLDPVDGQHRTVRRLGDARETRVNVRVIFGTNRDLWAMARVGTFRTDLLGRVSTHHVELPGIAAIRHRIVSAYQQQFEALAEAHGVDRITLHLDARTALFDFVFDEVSPWHWNYRDVIQSAERMVLRARDDAPHAARLVVDAAAGRRGDQRAPVPLGARARRRAAVVEHATGLGARPREAHARALGGPLARRALGAQLPPRGARGDDEQGRGVALDRRAQPPPRRPRRGDQSQQRLRQALAALPRPSGPG